MEKDPKPVPVPMEALMERDGAIRIDRPTADGEAKHRPLQEEAGMKYRITEETWMLFTGVRNGLTFCPRERHAELFSMLHPMESEIYDDKIPDATVRERVKARWMQIEIEGMEKAFRLVREMIRDREIEITDRVRAWEEIAAQQHQKQTSGGKNMIQILVGSHEEIHRWKAHEKKHGHRVETVTVRIGKGFQVSLVWKTPEEKNDSMDGSEYNSSMSMAMPGRTELTPEISRQAGT